MGDVVQVGGGACYCLLQLLQMFFPLPLHFGYATGGGGSVGLPRIPWQGRGTSQTNANANVMREKRSLTRWLEKAGERLSSQQRGGNWSPR
eukprot:GHVU01121622.1.p2 GENE.GHVU01121622.1~~GHVU01121622.1.p2  ORF type:complete len:101 (+),score=9.09 GHVU01121622.1:32-304(+)